MNTGHYVTPQSLIFNAAGNAGDISFDYLPKGFYMSLIRDAFRDLNMASHFSEQRQNIPFPERGLSVDLPDDCFSVKNVYIFSGTECVIEKSKKVYWKNNYYTQGFGSIANNKWNNGNDPIFQSNSIITDNIPEDQNIGLDLLYYNIQMNKLMLSSNCRGAGNMIHIHYSGTGSSAFDAPIIPIYFKTAIEDFITEAALRFRMANEPEKAKVFQYLHQIYSNRLDKNGVRGSWHEAIMLARSMNESQRNELNHYLSRGGWATGR